MSTYGLTVDRVGYTRHKGIFYERATKMALSSEQLKSGDTIQAMREIAAKMWTRQNKTITAIHVHRYVKGRPIPFRELHRHLSPATQREASRETLQILPDV